MKIIIKGKGENMEEHLKLKEIVREKDGQVKEIIMVCGCKIKPTGYNMEGRSLSEWHWCNDLKISKKYWP